MEVLNRIKKLLRGLEWLALHEPKLKGASESAVASILSFPTVDQIDSSDGSGKLLISPEFIDACNLPNSGSGVAPGGICKGISFTLQALIQSVKFQPGPAESNEEIFLKISEATRSGAPVTVSGYQSSSDFLRDQKVEDERSRNLARYDNIIRMIRDLSEVEVFLHKFPISFFPANSKDSEDTLKEKLKVAKEKINVMMAMSRDRNPKTIDEDDQRLKAPININGFKDISEIRSQLLAELEKIDRAPLFKVAANAHRMMWPLTLEGKRGAPPWGSDTERGVKTNKFRFQEDGPNDDSIRSMLAEIKASIDRGNPVVMAYSAGIRINHAVLVVGYETGASTTEIQRLLVLDSNFPGFLSRFKKNEHSLSGNGGELSRVEIYYR